MYIPLHASNDISTSPVGKIPKIIPSCTANSCVNSLLQKISWLYRYYHLNINTIVFTNIINANVNIIVIGNGYVST